MSKYAVEISGPAWDLSEAYQSLDDEQLALDLAEMNQLFDRAEKLNSKLQRDEAVATAQALTRLRENAAQLLSNVGTYAHCLLSVDSGNEQAQKLSGKLKSYRKRYGDVFEPLAQFLDDADDAAITAYLDDEEVAPSEFLVHHSRQRAFENLNLTEERLVNGLAQDGIHAWGKLYDQLASSIVCHVTIGNQQRTMGIAEANGLMAKPEDHQREAAWRAINSAWEGHEEAASAGINAIAGWRLEMCKQRSHTKEVHFLDAPAHMNRISKQTLETLFAVAEETKPLAQRAARLQARCYGKSGFGPWDLRAPAPLLGGVKDISGVAFNDAIDLIAQAYGHLDSSMRDFVYMMADKKWIEGTRGPRKSPGAYCTAFAKSRTPRVYMTYVGSQSDIITLAHELGHAYHAWVMRDMPESQKSYGMSLAETASTFGETLVRDTLLAQAEEPQARLNMMWEEIGAFTAFLLNIPTRFDFERKFYERRVARPLRPQELKDLMSEAWRTWYGDALAEPDPMFWASKLHFYISELSFYNFPYLFGYLFSLGVYARKDLADGDFFERYVALLRDTGRMKAEDIAVRHLNSDLTEKTFWRETMTSLEARVDAFEDLLIEVGL